MPQMSPLNWLLLAMVFILTYIMFNMLNYFIYKINAYSTLKPKHSNPSLNWKW